jgi:protein TonB
MSPAWKLAAMVIAVLLHVPLFWQVSEGLQRGQAVEGNATQSGITLKLASRPAPTPAAPVSPPKALPLAPARPKPVAEVKPSLAPAPAPEPAPEVTRESSDSKDEEDDSSDANSVSGGQVMGLAGASNQGTNDSEIERYLGVIQSRIQRLKEYPAQARLRGQEGTVEVSFAVGANGEIEDFRIVRSSGSALLDRAVERLFVRLRLPPPDQELLPQLSSLSLPVLFELSSL